MRRGVGVSGLRKKKTAREKYKAVGESVATMQMSQLQEQLDLFRTKLQEFAAKHKSDINNDPELRYHFQKMCQHIGVDPLACMSLLPSPRLSELILCIAHKGFWAEILGVGSFYYELGVQIVSVCVATRAENGGLVEMISIWELVRRMRGDHSHPITLDDINRAIKKLQLLGSGYKVVDISGRRFVQSIPWELRTDHTLVLTFCGGKEEGKRYSSEEELIEHFKWTRERSRSVIDELLESGLAWLDGYTQTIWFPSFFAQ